MAADRSRRAIFGTTRWTVVVLALLVSVGLLAVAYFVIDGRGWRLAIACVAFIIAAGAPMVFYLGRKRVD